MSGISANHSFKPIETIEYLRQISIVFMMIFAVNHDLKIGADLKILSNDIG